MILRNSVPSRSHSSLRLWLGWAVVLLALPLATHAQQQPAKDDAAPAAPRLFGNAFLLQAEDIDLTIVNNEVTDLVAVKDVNLETESLIIISHRLTFENATKVLRAYAHPETGEQVLVMQNTTITFCDTFEYNTETEEASFDGRVSTKVKQEDGRDLEVGGSIMVVEQSEGGSTRMSIREDGFIGSNNFQSRNQRDASGRLVRPQGVNPTGAEAAPTAPTATPTPVPLRPAIPERQLQPPPARD